MESSGDHDYYIPASTNQIDHKPGCMQNNDRCTSKRRLEVDDECQSEHIDKRPRLHSQVNEEHGAAVIDSERSDLTIEDHGSTVDSASLQSRRTASQSKRVRFGTVLEIPPRPPKTYAQDSDGERTPSTTPRAPAVFRKPHTQKGQADKKRTGASCTPSSSQPQTPNDYFPFLASMMKEREWKAKEDRYLLEAAKRGDTFSVMSKTLIRPEQACRNRVVHLIRVLQKQLAEPSMGLDEELLSEIKQEMAERSGELGKVPSEPEDALGSDEEGEDDAIMKLVIWKFYQRRGALDPAVMETHEGLREELDAFEWIEPQLLEVAAKAFITRRAEASRQRNPSGSQVVDERKDACEKALWAGEEFPTIGEIP